ncbi:PilT/PilU family type 4a pilus ATPase [Candidatus Peribacteria bacterium]|nr:PilT/PilU family type 4a pilus ATPase [Candidatus Peribacteria bacterium]
MPLDYEQIIDYAAQELCSDVHFSPNARIYLRRNTVLQAVGEPITNEQILEMLGAMLQEQDQLQLEQQHQVDFVFRTAGGTRLRGNAFHEDKGTGVSFRIIRERPFPIQDLGFPEFVLERIAHMRNGLVLVVGPTGQGKSTTLASFLQHRAEQQTGHIITIEDPVEYLLQSDTSVIQQREVGRDVRDFHSGIKSCLRADPDVIMVGEMRDLEAISATLTLAETGHVVFSTLHTSSGPQTVSRIIDVFSADQQEQVRSQLATTLSMVISQRLVPRADGAGLVLAYEILTSNYAIQNYIRQNKVYQIPNAFQADTSGEMVQLEQSLAGLVLSGIITKDTAYEYCRNSEQLTNILKTNGIEANGV